jgi:hypothetical protein
MTTRARISDAKLRRLARLSLETRCAIRAERDGSVTVLPLAPESVHPAPQAVDEDAWDKRIGGSACG